MILLYITNTLSTVHCTLYTHSHIQTKLCDSWFVWLINALSIFRLRPFFLFLLVSHSIRFDSSQLKRVSRTLNSFSIETSNYYYYLLGNLGVFGTQWNEIYVSINEILKMWRKYYSIKRIQFIITGNQWITSLKKDKVLSILKRFKCHTS